MAKQIVIKVPEWVDKSLVEESSKILVLLELNKSKSPKGLIKEIEGFGAKLSKGEIHEFLRKR